MLIVGWVVLALLVGIWADRRGRTGGAYFLLALILSPLLAWLILLAIGPVVAPSRPTYYVPPVEKPDNLRTIGALADLRDRGAITPDEFERKKSDLLART